MHHRMSPSKTGRPSLNLVIFPPVMRLVLDDPKQWPPRWLLIKIHELILEDRRISAKSIAEQLGISRERFGSIILEDLDMRKLSAKSKTSTVPVFWATFGIFSARYKWFPVVRDWWPWTKPSYISMTRRQSNNEWSGGIAAHPAPKFPSAKICWKSSRLDFLGSRGHPPHWLSSKGPNYEREVLLISAGAIEGYFEGKTLREGHQWGLPCSWTTMPRLTGHLQPRRNWPTLASSVLITHPILRIWLRRTTTCSLDWKQLKGRHFSSDAEVIAAAATWLDGQPSEFFFSGFQKLEQWAKKCIELLGECDE